MAKRGGQTLAIEIETGASAFEQDARNCMRSGFDQILVVTANEVGLANTEQALARIGLLILVEFNWRFESKRSKTTEVQRASKEAPP